ncbi:NB-ARC domain-containing protein [Actinoplanes sp. NPDC023936]|uniref:NB-ARC domain-containing protein n=1 Tax=Actinoplanes sp. NPDC023936 TaxID=3154910 RepID=UPI0034106485
MTAFSDRLTELFDCAGSPTNQAVARQAGERITARRVEGVRPADYTGLRPFDHKRLSSWRTAKHVPHDWRQLAAVLTVLFELGRGRRPGRSDLYDAATWRRSWEAARAGDRDTGPRHWNVPRPEDDLIPRPELLDAVVTALTRGSVVLTAVHGAGGFGKTSLLKQACHHPSVVAAHDGGALWAELGEDLRGAELAARVNDLTEQLTGNRPLTTDPLQAGFRLGAALDARDGRVLLAVDDVWLDDQIRPFLAAARSARLIVTTRFRLPSLAGEPAVRVPEMSAEQAASVLSRGTPGLPARIMAELITLTGGWPLLLGIANRAIVRRVEAGRDPAVAGSAVADRLHTTGPASMDGGSFSNEQRRDRMVAASVGASVEFLPPAVRDRYRELAVFAEGEEIPARIAGLLWGLDDFETDELCWALADASLIGFDGRAVRLHDVLRAHLRMEIKPDIAGIHGKLVDAAACLAEAWWELPPELPYLRHHLVRHLHEAGRDATALVTDLRWLTYRLRHDGPAAAEADTAIPQTAEAGAVGAVIRRNAHLLDPLEPPHALGDILASRMPGRHLPGEPVARHRLVNRWAPPNTSSPELVRVFGGSHYSPTGAPSQIILAAGGAILLRTWERHPVVECWDPETGKLLASMTAADNVGCEVLAHAADGSLLVSSPLWGYAHHHGAEFRTLTVWDPRRGTRRSTVNTGFQDASVSVVTPADGRWIAVCGIDPPGPSMRHRVSAVIRLFDPDDGTEIRTLDTGHLHGVEQMSLTGDGTRLITKDAEDPVWRFWDTSTATLVHELNLSDPIDECLSVSPDGDWIVTIASPHVDDAGNVTAHLRDTMTGGVRAEIDVSYSGFPRVTASPDGRWLATVTASGHSGDTLVQVWRSADGALLQTMEVDSPTSRASIAVAPDSRWFAVTENDNTALVLWDAHTGQSRGVIGTGTLGVACGVGIAPHGRWIATAGGILGDPAIRIWNTAGATRSRSTAAASACREAHVPAAGGWVVAHEWATDNALLIRDARTGHVRLVLRAMVSWQTPHIVVAPDGSWLATINHDRTVGHPALEVRDSLTGSVIHRAHIDSAFVQSMALSRDGRWLLSADGRSHGGKRGESLVRLWDTSTWTVRWEIQSGHPTGVGSIAIAPGGDWFATTGLGSPADPTLSTVRLGRLVEGTPRLVIDIGPGRAVSSIAPTPDGAALITQQNGARSNPYPGVELWDTTSGERRLGIEVPHHFGGGAVACAPDGSWLTAVGTDVRGWTTADGTSRFRIGEPSVFSRRRVVIAPDSAWFAVTRERSVQVFDSYGEPLAGMRVDGHINDCAVSADGRVIYVAASCGLHAFDLLHPGEASGAQ